MMAIPMIICSTDQMIPDWTPSIVQHFVMDIIILIHYHFYSNYNTLWSYIVRCFPARKGKRDLRYSGQISHENNEAE